MTPYRPVLATLGYVFHPTEDAVLMVHRTKRATDAHLGKYNGLGGKLEPDEDIVSGMAREIREEAGIECTEMELAGTISWPGFGKGGEDWFGFLFRVLAFTGTPLTENAEGTLAWVPCGRVLDLPLWPGDREFLPRVLDRASPPFHGMMPYRDGQMLSWRVTTLGRPRPG